MRKIVKRIAAAASAVVIGGVSCVTTWFSVPVAAAGGFGWLEWAEFDSLLQGVGWSSGGGSYKSVQEATLDWLNMTSDQFYKLTDPTDGGNAKPIWEQSWWGDMTDWLDNVVHSWSEDYSGIADVGAGSSGGGSWSVDGWSTWDGMASFTQSFRWDAPLTYQLRGDQHVYFEFSQKYYNRLVIARYGSSDNPTISAFTFEGDLWRHKGFSLFSGSDIFCFASTTGAAYSNYSSISRSDLPLKSYDVIIFDSSCFDKFCSDLGLTGTIYQSANDVCNHLNSITPDWQPGKTGTDGFVGPVYTYLAAQDLYKSTGTAAGVRLDVQTQDGVPDLQAALDGAGVDTVDDLVAGVAAGTVPMSKVFSDAKVTPYVVADTTAGTVVTDLGVSATATGVKAVGLTQDLAVPKDLTNAATYVVKGKTWDPEMSKYKLPLFQYFPFCLPWDIYQVLAAFSADPVAPVFDIPVGKILSGVRSADVSKAASLSAKIDFGDDNWSKVFEVIRILECAGIIVGLCLVAVYLIHGGR